jgi:hypothetical protein
MDLLTVVFAIICDFFKKECLFRKASQNLYFSFLKFGSCGLIVSVQSGAPTGKWEASVLHVSVGTSLLII